MIHPQYSGDIDKKKKQTVNPKSWPVLINKFYGVAVSHHELLRVTYMNVSQALPPWVYSFVWTSKRRSTQCSSNSAIFVR